MKWKSRKWNENYCEWMEKDNTTAIIERNYIKIYRKLLAKLYNKISVKLIYIKL